MSNYKTTETKQGGKPPFIIKHFKSFILIRFVRFTRTILWRFLIQYSVASFISETEKFYYYIGLLSHYSLSLICFRLNRNYGPFGGLFNSVGNILERGNWGPRDQYFSKQVAF